MTDLIHDKYFSAAGAAKELGICRVTLTAWARNKKYYLPYERIGTMHLFEADIIYKLKEHLKTTTPKYRHKTTFEKIKLISDILDSDSITHQEVAIMQKALEVIRLRLLQDQKHLKNKLLDN